MRSESDEIAIMSLDYDVIIIGAGAAGLFAGSNCAKRGLSTLVVDHAAKPAEKIRRVGVSAFLVRNEACLYGCFCGRREIANGAKKLAQQC